jgi:hypothetical protein
MQFVDTAALPVRVNPELTLATSFTKVAIEAGEVDPYSKDRSFLHLLSPALYQLNRPVIHKGRQSKKPPTQELKRHASS